MADAHGLDVAMRFAVRFGGLYLHLPARADDGHPVAREFGIDLLAWLIERHDHCERIVVPKAALAQQSARRAAVRSMTANGDSSSAIAQHLALHVRQVHRMRERIAAEDQRCQPELPFGDRPSRLG